MHVPEKWHVSYNNLQVPAISDWSLKFSREGKAITNGDDSTNNNLV